MKLSKLMKHTLIMTAVNLIMRCAAVGFNAFLTSKIGSSGMGLFQLVMTVYTLATTFSSAGIKLATTRVAVEINTLNKSDMNKSVSICITYAGICGCVVGIVLYIFSDFIAEYWIADLQTALPLRILSLSLPFVAMSAALGGYFTAIEKIPQFSSVQLIEQFFRIAVVVILVSKQQNMSAFQSCISIVAGMTAAEIFSFTLSSILKRKTIPSKTNKPHLDVLRMLRVALPDAAGTCVRSALLTIEHLLIPKGFKKSGEGSDSALAAYGNIHGIALPLLLFPSAVLASLSSLLVPFLATKYEIGDKKSIDNTVSKNLKRTFIFSIICAMFCAAFAPSISQIVYKSNEAVMYIRILSPLVPIMYMDMITDGMLKGLDQQIHAMRYNIIDAAFCIVMVYTLLPLYSVKGYIFILYASEIINFYLSLGRLSKICNIRLFQAREADNSTLFRTKKCSGALQGYEYHTYQGLKKHSQGLRSFRRIFRTQDLHEWL